MKLETKNISSIDLNGIENMVSRKTGRPLSSNYKDKMYRTGRKFNEFLKNRSKILSYEAIESFIDILSEKLSPKTLYPRVNALRSILLVQPFVKDLSPEERIEYYGDLWRLFKKKRATIDYRPACTVKQKMIPVLTDQQISQIFEVTSERNELLFKFMLCTGCSLREILKIRKEQISKSNPSYAVIDLSNQYNDQRKVYVSKKLLDEINKIFNGGKYLFETTSHQPMDRAYIRREFKKIGNKLSPPVDLNSEVIQNTFAEKLKKEGYSESQIKQYVGKPVDKNVNEQIGDSVVRHLSLIHI